MPPAFVLSQDQTLQFELLPTALRPIGFPDWSSTTHVCIESVEHPASRREHTLSDPRGPPRDSTGLRADTDRAVTLSRLSLRPPFTCQTSAPNQPSAGRGSSNITRRANDARGPAKNFSRFCRSARKKRPKPRTAPPDPLAGGHDWAGHLPPATLTMRYHEGSCIGATHCHHRA